MRVDDGVSVKVTEEFCLFCFQVLLAELQDQLAPSFDVPDLVASAKVLGLFVTWQLPEAKLRGCIGTFRPVKLEGALAEFALQSSLTDRRFRPVVLEEVPLLSCRVSVLHSFEPCQDAYDWEIGTHGVRIDFTVVASRLCPCSATLYSATFLPEVMVEHGMSHEVAIDKLVRKAGYRGRCDDGLIESIDATRFQSSIKEVSYDDVADRLSGGLT
mmetsp:Transcript_1197/g.4169  ORF Transcript_1197/g.4169 Transcript_1197/m.4169 type:complete len:214 (+) Transcript_1197:125-766(+)